MTTADGDLVTTPALLSTAGRAAQMPRDLRAAAIAAALDDQQDDQYHLGDLHPGLDMQG